MKRRRWKTIALIAVVLYLLGKVYCDSESDDQTAAGTELLQNRFWIERLPGNERDGVRHAMFIRERGQQVGGVGQSSAFRMHFDLVSWKLERDTLAVHFLQEDAISSYRAKTWKCRDEAPRPFTICLELDGPGGRQRYFSREEWKAGELPEDAPELVRALNDHGL